MDDLDRAAARLDRAADWAGMTVALVVGSLVAIAIWIATLAILIGSMLNRIGAPV